MNTTHNSTQKSSAPIDVEELSPFDILVGDRHWTRGELPEDDTAIIGYILEKWRNGGISAFQAIDDMRNSGVLDWNAAMVGLYAYYRAGAPDIPIPPAPPPSCPPMRLREPSYAVLEALAKARVA